MAHTTVSATGPLTVAEAWERYAVPARWSGWAPQITGVDYPPERLIEGISGLVHGPLGVRIPFTVLEVSAPDWVWQVRVGPVRITLRHTLVDEILDGGTIGCRAAVSIQGPWPLRTAYAPLARLSLARLTR